MIRKICFCIILSISLCLLNSNANGEPVEFTAMTLGEGFTANARGKDILTSPYFLEQEKNANEAGISLKQYLNNKITYAYKDGTFYLLYFNAASALSCGRDYLIQKVKLTKSFELNGKKTLKYEYLVEVCKLNNLKNMKGADAHHKMYGIGPYDNRDLVLDVELGCGVIPGIVDGTAWPFAKGIRYKRIQDYSETAGYYNSVIFDSSSKYSLEFDFDKNGQYHVSLPSFLK